jgi:hypothetical protein
MLKSFLFSFYLVSKFYSPISSNKSIFILLEGLQSSAANVPSLFYIPFNGFYAFYVFCTGATKVFYTIGILNDGLSFPLSIDP